MNTKNTLTLQTDYFNIFDNKSRIVEYIVRKQRDVKIQKKSHPQISSHAKPSAEQGVDPRPPRFLESSINDVAQFWTIFDPPSLHRVELLLL